MVLIVLESPLVNMLILVLEYPSLVLFEIITVPGSPTIRICYPGCFRIYIYGPYCFRISADCPGCFLSCICGSVYYENLHASLFTL